MRRSGSRRAATRRGPDRRILGAAAALVVFGGIIGVTQISNAAETPKAATTAGKTVNGLEILADTCDDSTLAPHDGFQKGDRCVSTEFGEVASAAHDASLLITQAPRSVTANTPFTLKVSTRNLIRDRFLAAGAGGYYVESSVLKNGIVRGHFHTACRMLASTSVAPPPDPVPAFFVATEDSKGSATPDVVTIAVPGLPTAGTAQCASWAGDGSHRIPMMERANQTPAIDAVRITVRNGGQQGGGQQGGGQQGGGQQGGNNGGQQGGNNGGNNGGQQGGNNGNQGGQPTPPPPVSTKGDVTPNPTTKPPTKPSPTKSTQTHNSGTSSDNSNNNENAGTSGDDSTPAETPTTKATTKKSTKSAGAATTSDDTYGDSAGTKTENQAATQSDTEQKTVDAAPAADKKDQSKLALTGSNTAKVLGGGAILLVVGLLTLAATRRRRAGSSGGW
jgi:hypothetical protein